MRIEALFRHGSILAALTAVPCLLAVHTAQAQCQADSDCSAGYRCASTSSVSCGYCPFPAGDAGRTAVDGGVAWDPFGCDAGCTTYEWRYCTPKDCEQDSDCPFDMRCHSETYSECNFGCKPGFDCEPDAGYTCMERTQRTCVERYNLPCQADEECGGGFDCNRDPYSVCWGGGGVVLEDDGGFTFVDAGSGCDTVTPDAGYCNLLELPCESNADCSSGLSCQVSYFFPPCVFDAGAPVADAGFPIDKEDAGLFLPSPYYCPPPVAQQVCRPERWAVDAGSGGSIGGGIVGGTTGGGFFGGGDLGGGFLGGLGGSYPDAGIATGFDAGAAPPSTGSAGGGVGGVGSADAGSAAGEDEDEGHGHGHGKHPRRGLGSLLRGLFGAGGCALGGEGAQGNFAWLALLSTMLVLRTRRRD